ncbi:MAG: hypothetical protein MK033_08125 [Candidatus Caenarcaniphilales bacterium]|nr:hypothetical protein [Candidatus Caenarcaniphilales bacterium]
MEGDKAMTLGDLSVYKGLVSYDFQDLSNQGKLMSDKEEKSNEKAKQEREADEIDILEQNTVQARSFIYSPVDTNRLFISSPEDQNNLQRLRNGLEPIKPNNFKAVNLNASANYRANPDLTVQKKGLWRSKSETQNSLTENEKSEIVDALYWDEFGVLNIQVAEASKPESRTTSLKNITNYQSKLIKSREAVDSKFELAKNDIYRVKVNVGERVRIFNAKDKLDAIENKYIQELANYLKKVELSGKQYERMYNLLSELKEHRNGELDLNYSATISNNYIDLQNVFALNLNTNNETRTEIYKQRLFKDQSQNFIDDKSQINSKSGEEINFSTDSSIIGINKNGEDLETNRAILHNPGGEAVIKAIRNQKSLAGNYIELDYANGLVSQFLHLPDASIVKKNGVIIGVKDPSDLNKVLKIADTVSAGQAFAFLGATGEVKQSQSSIRHYLVDSDGRKTIRPKARGEELFRYLSLSLEQKNKRWH